MSDTLSKLADLETYDCSSQHLLQLAKTHRAGNNVKRYHTVNMLVQETVGHHSANVAILCVILSKNRPSVNLLMAALLHDMAEQFTGDVPATAKWSSEALSKALTKLELEVWDCLMPRPGLTEMERRILKQADMLDLCFKTLEEYQLGNKGALLILRRGLSYLSSNSPLPMTISFIKEIQHELSE